MRIMKRKRRRRIKGKAKEKGLRQAAREGKMEGVKVRVKKCG